MVGIEKEEKEGKEDGKRRQGNALTLLVVHHSVEMINKIMLVCYILFRFSR